MRYTEEGRIQKSESEAHRYLGVALEVKGDDVVSAARLTLTHQEHSVALETSHLHQLGCLHARDGPVEPRVRGEEVICFVEDLLCRGKVSSSSEKDKQMYRFASMYFQMDARFLQEAKAENIINMSFLENKNKPFLLFANKSLFLNMFRLPN